MKKKLGLIALTLISLQLSASERKPTFLNNAWNNAKSFLSKPFAKAAEKSKFVGNITSSAIKTAAPIAVGYGATTAVLGGGSMSGCVKVMLTIMILDAYRAMRSYGKTDDTTTTKNALSA